MNEEKDDLLARKVEAVSGVNIRGEGFVHLSMDMGEGSPRAVLQATPAQAREIAQHISEAAEAADTDSFIFQFMQAKVGLDVARAGMVLVDFRKWRELSGGVKNRERDDPHWQEMMRKNDEPKP